MEIGNDVVEIDRFNNMQNLDLFLEKYFNKIEIDYILTKSNKPMTVAGLFSAKEAILKAIGVGIGNGLDLKDITIMHDNYKKPFVEINDKLLNFLAMKKCTNVKISISHTEKIASSVCIIY